MWPFVSIPGLVTLGVGCALSLWSKVHNKEELALRRARRLHSLEDINACKASLPVLVAVSGCAISNQPLQCKLSTDKAVIHELTEEEIIWKATWKDLPGKDVAVLKQERQEAEWFLADDTPQQLRVQGGHTARLLTSVMQQRQVFHRDVGRSRWRGVLEHLMCNTLGMRCTILVGTRDTERHLPVGAIVTVVGELADASSKQHPMEGWWGWGKDDEQVGSQRKQTGGAQTRQAPSSTPIASPSEVPTHRLVLRKPAGGGPFYITSMSLPELQAALTQSASLLQHVAGGMMVMGSYLLLHKALQCFWRWHQHRQWLRELQTGGSGGSYNHRQHLRQEEERRTKLLGTCIVCMEEQVGCVYVGCGHLCCCTECADALHSCPICRTVSQSVRVFPS